MHFAQKSKGNLVVMYNAKIRASIIRRANDEKIIQETGDASGCDHVCRPDGRL